AEDESMDLVTVAQAFHWFDAEPAIREIARVLKPGGGLAALWNVRDESVEWMAMIGELIEGPKGSTPHHATADWRKPFDSGGSPFEPLHIETYKHRQEVTRADAVDVFASRSYVASLPEDERRRLLERVAEQVPK